MSIFLYIFMWLYIRFVGAANAPTLMVLYGPFFREGTAKPPFGPEPCLMQGSMNETSQECATGKKLRNNSASNILNCDIL